MNTPNMNETEILTQAEIIEASAIIARLTPKIEQLQADLAAGFAELKRRSK